jgi:hypothetical protein
MNMNLASDRSPEPDHHARFLIFLKKKSRAFLLLLSQLVSGRRPGARVQELRALRRAFLGEQAMRVHGSLWNGESWATQGGRVKTNWSAAPFVASYGGYAASACVVVAQQLSGGSGASSGCPPNNVPSSPGGAGSWAAWMDRQLGPEGVAWARANYVIYDYCDDVWRFPQGPPAECNLDGIG